MYAYVHIELVISSGKCSRFFFFLNFTCVCVCVKANLKAMILLITAREHFGQVFARLDDFNSNSLDTNQQRKRKRIEKLISA